jgi:hypothetical protein
MYIEHNVSFKIGHQFVYYFITIILQCFVFVAKNFSSLISCRNRWLSAAIVRHVQWSAEAAKNMFRSAANVEHVLRCAEAVECVLVSSDC